MKKLGINRSYRDCCGEFLCDGLKLLEDAVRSGAEITAVLTAASLPFSQHGDTVVYQTEQELIESISPLSNAQEVLFSCRTPAKKELREISGLYILLDGVQDPGNVGAIIRTANAFNTGGVILTGDCADPYNPKSVRASMGAIFRQSIFELSIQEISLLKDKGAGIIGAAKRETAIDIRKLNPGDAIIAIGNEGRGLSDAVTVLCDGFVMIPINPECESLNAAVAAAVIMWEAGKTVRN